MTDFSNLTVEQKIERIRADVAEIHRAITGNGLGMEKGLVGCVKELESEQENLCRRIQSLEQRWDRLRWTIAGAVVGAAGLSGGLTALFTHLIGGG